MRAREADRPAIVPSRAREDHDDRPERMVRDPARYFADARKRAEREVMNQADWLLDGDQHRKAR